MSVGIRELKRRYRMSLATGAVLPTHDLGIPLPLSTGNPLFDAALTDKLVATTTMNEPEHLNRAWQLVRKADGADVDTLSRSPRGLLNDYKLLLALRAWNEGNEELTRTFLRAMPWGWRLSFPAAVIKPAAVLFTGWRRTVRFRLGDDPRFPALRELFRELLREANGVTILKYRSTIKESAALLKYRFEGERERAIHALCFNRGRGAEGQASLEPVGTYVRARDALASKGTAGFIDVLGAADAEIPITSFMGLLGGRGIGLDGAPELQDYAIRCATAVESLLRLVEWSPWLEERHAAALSAKVRHGVIERGLDIPFFKVTKAFMMAPTRVRKLLLEPLYRPLLHHFGRKVAGLLPAPGPLTFMQPYNVVHIMSFLLYATLATAAPTRLLLLRHNGVDEVEDLDTADVIAHLADDRTELQRWLLGQFGGLSTRHAYLWDYPAAARSIAKLDPEAPLVLDLPFTTSIDILSALRPFERVFNLSSAFGAPGEVCIAYEYYATFMLQSRGWSYGVWERRSDAAATRFAEFLDRLGHFQALAGGAS